jgi:hypothetical protein
MRTQEMAGLENENKAVKVEIAELVQTIERLAIERTEMEGKLDGVKIENAKLVRSNLLNLGCHVALYHLWLSRCNLCRDIPL